MRVPDYIPSVVEIFLKKIMDLQNVVTQLLDARHQDPIPWFRFPSSPARRPEGIPRKNLGSNLDNGPILKGRR